MSVHFIQMKKASGASCPQPTVNVTQASLQDKLNKIWDQASVQFSIILWDTSFGMKAIQADNDNDCVADEAEPPAPNQPPVFGPELRKIDSVARDPKAEVNIYFVERYQLPPGAYHQTPKAIFIGELLGWPIEQITAHELGHHLGLDERNGRDALMQPGSTAQPPLCLLNKLEWDCANKGVGCP